MFKKAPLLAIICIYLQIMKSFADDKDDTFVIQFYTPEAAQDGAKLYVGQIMMIKSFCVRIYLNKVSGLQYPFFASVPNQGQFNLLFSFDVGYGFVGLNGRQIMFEIIDKPIPFTYVHFCLSHNGTNYIVAANGKTWMNHKIAPDDVTKINETTNIEELSFGPMPNPTDNRFSPFSGSVGELNIFSNTFSEQDLVSISGSCQKITIGKKEFSWAEKNKDDVQAKESKGMEVKPKEVVKLCSKKPGNKIEIVPKGMSLAEADDACKALGGSVFMPGYDEEDFEDMIDRANESELLKKIIKKECKDCYWLPVKKADDMTSGTTWIDFKDSSKTIKPTFQIIENGYDLQKCAYYYMKNGQSHDVRCRGKYCTFCLQHSKVPYTLKGLCKASSIDQNFVLMTKFLHNGLLGKLSNFLF